MAQDNGTKVLAKYGCRECTKIGPGVLDKISGGKDIKDILVSPCGEFGGAVAEHSISIPNKLFPCTLGGLRFSC